MRDEYDSRLWLEHGKQFSADIASFLHAIGRSFALLNAKQFNAPWRRHQRTDRTC